MKTADYARLEKMCKSVVFFATKQEKSTLGKKCNRRRMWFVEGIYVPDTFMGIFRRNEVNTIDYINIIH
jgi:hypothetical protein